MFTKKEREEGEGKERQEYKCSRWKGRQGVKGTMGELRR